MNPFHFGAPEAPLFGMYTPPRASVARPAGVLLCAPIGLEYIRTHYALRLLALQLAEAGYHVLRFDYHGVGDSSGTIARGQFDVWVDDVILAARELAEISGSEALTVVGLRAGAALALEALVREPVHTPGLVLWDPVTDGSDYLATLEALHAQMAAQRSEPPAASEELLGTAFPDDLRTALRGFELEQRLDAADLRSAALVVSEDRPNFRSLLAKIRSRWPDADYRHLTDPMQWDSLKAAFDARMTGPIVRAVAQATEALA